MIEILRVTNPLTKADKERLKKEIALSSAVSKKFLDSQPVKRSSTVD